MEVRFNSFRADQEDGEDSPENSRDLPASGMFNDTKTTSTTSPNARRGSQKRVVRVPIRDVEGSRPKNETNAPPSDSWAWRKYGQKPIKGSPYPRGYYKCSSSKGCPARKQVERSRADPTMVVVTYSCNHNHPWAASKTNHHHNSTASPPAASTATTPTIIDAHMSNADGQVEDPSVLKIKNEHDLNEKFTSLEVGMGGTLVGPTDQYEWFSDLESTSSTILESPLMARDITEDADMAMIFAIREDEDSFFADLDELPECTMVFRRREVERVEEHHLRPCNEV